MNYDTKIGWCSICNQGWLEIWKTAKSGKLTVVCSECEVQYDSPDDALRNVNSGLYSVDKDGIVTEPTIDELTQADWLRFILK